MSNAMETRFFEGSGPALALRGLHVDICRHFIRPETVLRIVDKMGRLRLNVLHLHLSDDQAFPVQFERFPSVGYDGIWTIEDQVKVAAACRERGIEIIPEIDIPGHCRAFLSTRDPAVTPEKRFGFMTIETIEIERDLPVIFGMFEELVERFGARRIHMGGDECPHYGRFPELVSRICGWAKERGLEVVAWDDVLDAIEKIPDNLIIQLWRRVVSPKIASTRFILSWGYYLNHVNDPFTYYDRDPCAFGEPLGCIACTWTELITDRTIECTVFPALYLLAHRWWHHPEVACHPPVLLRLMCEDLGYPPCDLDDWRTRRWAGLRQGDPRSTCSFTVEDVLDREEDLLPAFSRSLVLVADALYSFLHLGLAPGHEARDLLTRLGKQAYGQDLSFIWDQPADWRTRLAQILPTTRRSQLWNDGLGRVLRRVCELARPPSRSTPPRSTGRGTIYSTHPAFRPPSEEIEGRITEILGSLTLAQKVALLGGHQSGRLTKEAPGVMAYHLADGPLGVNWWRRRSTAYPATICAAATFDIGLVERLGRALGRDGRACGLHILLAPGVNLYRSPLCGRNFEYLGEDPFLAGRMAVAYVRGVQSQGVAATVKHFAINFQEYDRHGISSDVDERTLHEVYLVPFKAAVVEGGAGCVMTAYNLVNGVHCSENAYLIGILKNQWGFNGVVMSDWGGTYSTVGAVNAGLDLEMPRARFMSQRKIRKALRVGLVDPATLDDKCRRLVRLGLCFGWYDREQRDESIPLDDPESAEVALDVARGGVVLLRNRDGLLPLQPPGVRRIAVIGENAHPAVISGGGSAYTPPNRTISILEGIQAVAGREVEVIHTYGAGCSRESRVFPTSEFVTPDGQEGLLGEYHDNPDLAGKPVEVRRDHRVDFEWFLSPPSDRLPSVGFSVRWTGAVRVPRSGEYFFYVTAEHNPYRLLVDNQVILSSPGLRAWHGRATDVARLWLHAGEHPIQLDFHRVTTHRSGIHMGWEPAKAAAAELEAAVAAAASADAAIVCVGFTPAVEGEDHDRPYGLPKEVETLIQEVARVNPRTVVVLTAGGAVDARTWINEVGGLIHAFYPGQMGGLAVAEVLFGRVNPSGKLPFTWEKRLEDRSSYNCYHDDDRDGHVALSDGIFFGYRHCDREGIDPLFPFGFGLSYTSFAYEKLDLSSERITPDGLLVVRFDLVNQGSMAGAEVAQLYLSAKECSLPRPVKELKGFTKVFLRPGERRSVELTIGPEHLAFYHPDRHDWMVEPGRYEVLIGASARDIRLRGAFEVMAP